MVSSSPRIIGRGATVVKALHPIGALSSRIKLAPEARVLVERAADADSESAASDPAAAALRALAAPLDFPPLAQGTVPGDHLAIAVDETVPCAASVVQGVVAAAEAAGIERDAITIVTSDAEFADTLRADLRIGATDVIHFVKHDPDDPHNLCLVGALGKNGQLLVNRTIYDADIVLPIGCARLASASGGGGVYDSLFPRFCDAATIARLRTPTQRTSAERVAAARRATAEAGRLIGAPLVIQVVPGGDGSVADVVAGEPLAVAAECERRCRRLWSFRASRRASLVIATVTGGRQQQSWDNIARALAASEPLVADGGAVAICSNLDSPLGPALGRLVESDDWEGVERAARNDHSVDSWPAWHLARALQRGPVYFLSQLDNETAEEMGLAPVADVDELARLAGRQESCIVLGDSQYAVATVVDDP
jgi:nickel-dependent lactate racemase